MEKCVIYIWLASDVGHMSSCGTYHELWDIPWSSRFLPLLMLHPKAIQKKQYISDIYLPKYTHVPWVVSFRAGCHLWCVLYPPFSVNFLKFFSSGRHFHTFLLCFLYLLSLSAFLCKHFDHGYIMVYASIMQQIPKYHLTLHQLYKLMNEYE